MEYKVWTGTDELEVLVPNHHTVRTFTTRYDDDIRSWLNDNKIKTTIRDVGVLNGGLFDVGIVLKFETVSELIRFKLTFC